MIREMQTFGDSKSKSERMEEIKRDVNATKQKNADQWHKNYASKYGYDILRGSYVSMIGQELIRAAQGEEVVVSCKGKDYVIPPNAYPDAKAGVLYVYDCESEQILEGEFASAFLCSMIGGVFNE